MTYRYVKAPPGYTLKKNTSLSTHIRKGISAVFLTIGITAFTTVAYPMLYYQINYAPRLQPAKLVSPATPAVKKSLDTVQSAHASEPTFVREMINTTLDYTDTTTWFPEAKRASAAEIVDAQYYFAIPKLGIKNATVVTSHTDLKKSLIQYPGTAMPGDLGNTVIFGHSVLPQFFSPTNYVSIFSTLHTLVRGDEMQIVADGVEYKYKITEMYEVMPDDLSPLAQRYDGHHLTIITCTPPGTYLRRLIIKAELI